MEPNNELIMSIISRENMNQAFQKVKRNKGAAGVDEKDIEATRLYLKEHGQEIIRLIQDGKYKPQAVRRVEIPKPNGGKRNLGIPTVTDRVIQQARKMGSWFFLPIHCRILMRRIPDLMSMIHHLVLDY